MLSPAFGRGCFDDPAAARAPSAPKRSQRILAVDSSAMCTNVAPLRYAASQRILFTDGAFILR